MPFKDLEKKKEYHKFYNLKNKERKKETDRLRYINNKEKIKENMRLYNLKNKENNKERSKKYSQTENGKKSRKISNWIYKGIICKDFDKMYDRYINTNNCNWCNKDISKKRYLEHNHSSREVRGIVCQSCNMKIRYKDNNYQKCMLDINKSNVPKYP